MAIIETLEVGELGARMTQRRGACPTTKRRTASQRNMPEGATCFLESFRRLFRHFASGASAATSRLRYAAIT